jgi:hypothetical protein
MLQATRLEGLLPVQHYNHQCCSGKRQLHDSSFGSGLEDKAIIFSKMFRSSIIFFTLCALTALSITILASEENDTESKICHPTNLPLVCSSFDPY